MLACAALAGCAAGRGSSSTSMSANGRGQAEPGRPFVLTFWCGPPLAEFDDARAAEIATAGFTIVGPPCSGGFDAALNQRVLAVAARHGLGLWVGDHRFGPNITDAPDWQALVDDAAAEYRGHAAFAGYFVADEPPAPQFEPVAAVVAALHRADPAHLAYVNLLPNYIPAEALGAPSYEDYVEQFITTVRPRLLSYDYYPFGKEKDRSGFFTNLAVIAAAARRHGLPFMLIVLATPHGPYREPSEGELAWQVHHALAYGARGVSYFTYWTPPDDAEWEFGAALVDDGRPTMRYFQVARLNRGLRALGAALDGFTSIDVADSLGEIGTPLPIGPIDAVDGGPITVGLFGDGTGRLAALLVNRDYRYGTVARLRLRPSAAPPQVFDTDSAAWHPSGSLAYVLPPGGALLLGWGSTSGLAAERLDPHTRS